MYNWLFVCVYEAKGYTFLYQSALPICLNPGCVNELESPLLDSETEKPTRLSLQSILKRRICKMSLVKFHIKISYNNISLSTAVLVYQVRRPI
jgi:hypothetical protein